MNDEKLNSSPKIGQLSIVNCQLQSVRYSGFVKTRSTSFVC